MRVAIELTSFPLPLTFFYYSFYQTFFFICILTSKDFLEDQILLLTIHNIINVPARRTPAFDIICIFSHSPYYRYTAIMRLAKIWHHTRNRCLEPLLWTSLPLVDFSVRFTRFLYSFSGCVSVSPLSPLSSGVHPDLFLVLDHLTWMRLPVFFSLSNILA